MQDGSTLRICDLEDDHLVNILRHLCERYSNTGGRGANVPVTPTWDSYDHRRFLEEAKDMPWNHMLIYMWNLRVTFRGLIVESYSRGLLKKLTLKKAVYLAWACWKRRLGVEAGQVFLGQVEAFDEDAARTAALSLLADRDQTLFPIPGHAQITVKPADSVR